MGPQHPSTHGVLRLVLELEGETVTEVRPVIGYLHTGIEKNLEYRNWTQGTTFVTRADYLAPLFNEAGYCLAVEKLLGITDQITERANTIRVLFMELNRISSHLVWLATTGMELGAISMMLYGFREREYILDIFEETSGLRMNHAYFRPGGVAQDIPDVGDQEDPRLPRLPAEEAQGVRGPALRPDHLAGAHPGRGRARRHRLPGAGHHRSGAALGGPGLGPAQDDAVLRLRELRVRRADRDDRPTSGAATWCGWPRSGESLKIVEQALDRLKPGPILVADKKIAWPAQLAIGVDGMGNSLEHVAKIMGQSMESLIHHFKLVTEGFRVPPGQVYVGIEHPRGELGVHAVSDGGTHPYRVHMRDPSFVNLQAIPAMAEGALLADVIAGGASLDPVMGGCDR